METQIATKIYSRAFYHNEPLHSISSQSNPNILSNTANSQRETNKQINAIENLICFSEIKTNTPVKS